MQYRNLILIASFVLAIGLTVIPLRWPSSRHQTFSQHIAKHRLSIIYYIALFSFTLPLVVLFFIKYLTPRIMASELLNALVFTSAIAQFVCTLIPETGGRKSATHRTLAGISAIALAPAMLVIALCNVQGWISLVCFTALAIMVTCVVIVTKAKGYPKNFLILQSIYFAAFFVPLIIISYTH